jgi:hypothetical protein
MWRASSASTGSGTNSELGRVAAERRHGHCVPAPAEPTTSVSCLPVPEVNLSCSTDLVTSVPGSIGTRNLSVRTVRPTMRHVESPNSDPHPLR